MPNFRKRDLIVVARQFLAGDPPATWPPGVQQIRHPLLGTIHVFVDQDRTRIRNTDWVVRFPTGEAEAMADARFTTLFEPAP